MIIKSNTFLRLLQCVRFFWNGNCLLAGVLFFLFFISLGVSFFFQTAEEECALSHQAYDEIKGVCRPECADVTAKGVCLNHSLKCSLFTHENCEADEQDTAAYRLVENKKSFLGRAKTVFAHKNKVLKTKEALLLMNVSQNRKNFPPFLWVQKEGRFFMVKAYVNEDGALLDNPMALTCEQGQGLVYCFKQ